MTSVETAVNVPATGTDAAGTKGHAPGARHWRPFTKETRLRNARQLQNVREEGASEAGRLLVVRVIQSPDGQPRAAIVISRRFSTKAVIRNRARRLIREGYRRLFPELRTAWILMIPRQAIKGRMFQDVYPEMQRLFRRAGVLAAAAPAAPANAGGPAA